jgi:hypothetical protein
MKRLLVFILPCILAACGSASPLKTVDPTAVKSQEATQVPGFQATKLFQLTAQAETVTAGYPKNDATLTAILATKSAGGTRAAGTMTAQPSETPLPTLPADTPFCRSTELKARFGSNGATQQILLSAGLTNIGAGPCFLLVWPQIRLTDGQGQLLDVDYGYFDFRIGTSGAAATQRAQDYATAKVGLWPGWSVWANLIWQNWCAAAVPGGAVIQLNFSNATGIIKIPTDIQAGGTCNAPGQRSYVGIAKLVVMQAP